MRTLKMQVACRRSSRARLNTQTFRTGAREQLTQKEVCKNDNAGRSRLEEMTTEGRLQLVRPGLLYDRFILRTTHGQEQMIMALKSLAAINQEGRRIPLTALSNGQMLTIRYSEVTGTRYAEQMEIL